MKPQKIPSDALGAKIVSRTQINNQLFNMFCNSSGWIFSTGFIVD
ncbi:hypothetical protein ECDEC13D_4768 [Escherichia coli DEC13D]|nr:hypothetical protein ECDEC13D_4768 [Escherichia coli DEC13D]